MFQILLVAVLAFLVIPAVTEFPVFVVNYAGLASAVTVSYQGLWYKSPATFTFADGNTGTFSYSVDLGDGVNKATQSKAVTRQVSLARNLMPVGASRSGP